MLNKLKNLKEHINQGKNAITFDVSRFNHPIAEQVQWTPLGGGNTNMHTHKLTKVSSSRMEFQPTLKSKLFSLLFCAVGLGLTGIFLVQGMQSSDPDAANMSFFVLLFGLTFAGVGVFTYRKMSVPVVFDKVTGRGWRGRRKSDSAHGTEAPDGSILIRDITSLQLLSQYVRGNKNSYYVYELNAVMNDAKRYNIMRHGSKRHMRKDAETLSSFLGKPLWDAAG